MPPEVRVLTAGMAEPSGTNLEGFCAQDRDHHHRVRRGARDDRIGVRR
jgi:hypothetical protein